jgi:hypothetical protein
VTWKHEGAVLNFVNLTDMVSGSGSVPLRAEKPKLLYNNMTKKYVMWMVIDNGLRELGMAGVAVSDYHNGPFEFVRSLYPDGNQTHDQTLFQKEDGTAYLIRAYYQTVEYVLPKAVMQPTWESVKNADGSTNFALSYHRAEYEPGYDDYHDIYLQRWRTEDQPWKVICINRLTLQEREVPYGEDHLNFDGEVCQDPFEYKQVLGQGHPHYNNSKNGIQSRFLDPNDPSNNVWIPNSVPSVKGQSWKANYDEGTCGKDRKVNAYGIGIDSRHLLLLSDVMTFKGEVLGITRREIFFCQLIMPEIYFFEEKLLAHVISLKMFEGQQFPTQRMLGWLAGTEHWPIADIIAHSEFPIRTDMIIEQVRVNGFYFGVELETFGKFLCALYVSRRLPDAVLARLEEVDFPFSDEGE